MLISRVTEFSLTFSDIPTVGQTATVNWVATYRFTQTGRTVVNHINVRFAIRDGLIFEHRDNFDLWAWSRQALGLKGLLLGWSSFRAEQDPCAGPQRSHSVPAATKKITRLECPASEGCLNDE